MPAKPEEAAPIFSTWQERLKSKDQSSWLVALLSFLIPPLRQRLGGREGVLQQEVQRFLDVLNAVGTPMLEEPLVHFVFYGPEAQRVLLAGEFNQWGAHRIALEPLGRTGFFFRTLTINDPARLEYKLIVDGQWQLDPLCQNTVDNGLGDQNSYFVVGNLQEPPELEWLPTIPHGRVEEFDFDSVQLHNTRRVHAYLPPGYDDDPTERFPVLYIHDGSEYRSRAQFPTILDNLIHGQDIPPLIAVMVDPVDRMRMYWANEDYARFVEQELVPEIDTRYRTLATREARGVMGASLGGLISTYLGLTRPHLFSKVGGQSSAFFLEKETLTTLVQHVKVPIAFYFDVGLYEPRFIPAHQELIPLLEAKDCLCLYQELQGGHNWTSWRAHLKELLIFLWGTDVLKRENPYC